MESNNTENNNHEYKLWLHSDKKMNDWSLESFDKHNIDNNKLDIIDYKTDTIMLENILYYINSLNYSKNYHITLTNCNDYPIQEQYEHTSYYSFTNKFSEYNFWNIIVYSFITKSNIFKNVENMYGISYSCKNGKFIIKILYNINKDIGEIFNVNNEEYIKHISNSKYNLKYKFKFIN
jgi:hypothetical protein